VSSNSEEEKDDETMMIGKTEKDKETMKGIFPLPGACFLPIFHSSQTGPCPIRFQNIETTRSRVLVSASTVLNKSGGLALAELLMRRKVFEGF